MLIGSKNWCSSCASGLRSKRLWWRPLAVLIVVLAMSDRAFSAGWLETNPNNNQYPSNNNQFQSLLDSTSTNSNSGGGNGYYLNKPVFTYVGCFNDRRELRDVGDKDYTFITKFNKSLPTVELCVLLCAQDGYSIAGIQAFDECYCGNNYGRYNATDDTNCFFQCAGKYTCGGYNANSVYLISVKQTLNKDIDRSIAAVAPPKVALNTHLSAHQSSAANINNPLNNPCLSSPCLNSGMCITLMDDKGVPRGYICRCTNPQDSGAFCEDRNFCFSNPCLNGGSCANKLNGYSCKCTSHWTGFNCNIPANVIVPPPQLQLQPQAQPPLMMMPSLTTLNCFDHSKRCLNGGTCAKFPNELDYSCKCPHNYGGTQCEIFDVCAKRPCQHEGVCTFKPPQYYECKCTDSYYGANCERPNPCKNGTGKCANGAKCQIDFKNLGDYFCACEGNFVGKHCDQCKPQFTGKYCDRCVDGFTGPHCDLLINRCLPSPCANGICVMDGSSYKCICTEGWKGKNCTEKNCLLKPCSNEGVCTAIYDNSTNQVEYKCLCPNGFYGEQCQLKDSNPCMSNPCKPSEDCIQSTESPASFYCVQSMNICERIRPCNENSECIYSRENNTFYCRCLNGAAGCDSVYLSPTGPAGVGETTAPVATSTPVAANSAQPFESTLVVPKILAGVGGSSQGAAAGEVLNNAQSASGVAGSSRPKPEIPKFGFNYDNLYLILPVALVILVVVFFSSIVIYFGFKARSRTAKFNKKESNIRNIHYINENMTFDDNLKPIPSGSNSSIGFSNSDKEYNEGYGRV